MGGRIPPHCLVDVDVVDEEGYELAEEELQFKQNAGLDWQLRDLAVLQGHDSLGGQWRAGEARPRTAPGAGTDTGDRCAGSVAPTRAPRGSWLTEWISTVGCPVGTSSSSCGAQHKVDPQARRHISKITTWCLISSLNPRDP